MGGTGAGTALLAGGAAVGGVAGAKLAGGAVASAASSVARGTSRAAGGATMAYATGSAGKSGGAAVAGGMAGGLSWAKRGGAALTNAVPARRTESVRFLNDIGVSLFRRGRAASENDAHFFEHLSFI